MGGGESCMFLGGHFLFTCSDTTFAVVVNRLATMHSRLGVKATTCKAKAKDLILEDNKVNKTNISLPQCQNLIIVDIFQFLNVSSVTFLKHSVMLWLARDCLRFSMQGQNQGM